MPFLPLFIRQLGVTDLGEIALWTGAILGVTPALTAMLSPFWGRLADRFGRKLMVARSLVSCAAVMGAMAFVTHPWQVFALRALLGLLTGYGGLTLTMAAESAPRAEMASAIGLVQTAQRLGPAIGPVIGGLLAGTVGLRPTFLVTAFLYLLALLLVMVLYDERATDVAAQPSRASGTVGFRSVLGFENFLLLMAVIFAIQFVDRSFGPILPLYVEQLGVPRARVPMVAGVLFSLAAIGGALGHHFCGRLLRRMSARHVISGGAGAAAAASAVMAAAAAGGSGGIWPLAAAIGVFGAGLGTAMTAAYTAAGSVIPAGVHGTGFGLLSSASLTGLAVSPVAAGLLAATSMRAVFVLDVIIMAVLAGVVRHQMREVAWTPAVRAGADVRSDARRPPAQSVEDS